MEGRTRPRLLFMAVGKEMKEQLKAFTKAGFEVEHLPSLAAATQAVRDTSHFYDVVVTKLGSLPDNSDQGLPLVELVRSKDRRTFIAVLSWTACGSAATRLLCFEKGANMVTASMPDLLTVLAQIATQHKLQHSTHTEAVYACPSCNMDGLTAYQLRDHQPLYHVNEPNVPTVCPICPQSKMQSRFPVHLFNKHAPPGSHTELYPDTVIYAFALVVCQRPSDGRFLLVQEFASSGFWLPGGRVDPGEDLVTAAVRETKEEAGIDVDITGILRLEWSPQQSSPDEPYVRMRIIFYGRPKDEKQLPKSIPDYESVGAVWAQASDVAKESGLPLRGSEPRQWFTYVERGGAIHPLSLLTGEGARP